MVSDTCHVNAGRVYLVGAGPGDPGLITVRGLQCLQEADVIVHDRLVAPDLLACARPEAELVYCGKGPGRHTCTQEQINALLVREAREGKTVCRLKGGDPFVFGRGGEEALALHCAGVEFEVVPGVSSALAAGARAGIPVTQRGLAASFVVATGHEDPAGGQTQVDWRRIARAADTIVILMGVGQLASITRALIAAGRPPHTPVAVVSRATLPDQATLVGTLEGIAQEAEAAALQPPAVVIVGEVVALREKLAWLDRRPLSGRRVLVTRPREQARELSALLRRRGAVPVEMPVIRIAPPATWEPLDAALSEAHTYDWLVFTSANGVRFVRQRLDDLGEDVRALKGPRVAAVGPGTAAAAQGIGLRVALQPEEHRAEALLKTLEGTGLHGRRVLILQGADAGDAPATGAREAGAEVTLVPVYRTLPVAELDPAGPDALSRREIDVVTFTSASSARHFADAIGRARALELLEGVCVACIGPVTAATAREVGLHVDVQPEAYTIEALVAAIAAHLSDREGG